jgi:hypothetical protein
MPIQIIITDAGRAALVAAQHNGTNAVTIAQVGVSGTPIIASPTTAALPGEVKRLATISGGAVAADTMHMVVRDESGDVYSTRSFALYLADGTLFASYGQAGVIVEKSAQALMLLAVDVQFVDVAAAMITFGNANFLNPPATIDTAGVVKLATDAEAIAMANALKALTPRGMALAFTAANVLARLLTVDGAGSGLDADLLDGQDGTYYTNITARLGYTPLNAVNYTASDILGKLVTVDGSGSGLDADLLDGRQGAEFALLTGASFTGPISITGPIDKKLELRGSNASYLVGYNAAGVEQGFMQFNSGVTLWASTGDVTVYRSGSQVAAFTASGLNVASGIQIGGNVTWHAGNDGAGSGLDADLLDGRQGSEFALLAGAAFTGSITSTGTVVGASLRGSGFAPSPTGAGTEIHFVSGTGYIISYDRSAAAYCPLTIQASSLSISTTISVAGSILRAGNTVWDAGNDGSGSGLDADLLDGRHAADFALLSGATFTGIVSAASFNASGAIAAGTSLTRGGWTVWDQGNIAPWHVGNDGSGSGLDADLLDGLHASAFALLNGSGVFTGTVVSQANEAFRAAGVSPYFSFTNTAASTRWGYIQHTGAGGVLAIVNDQAGQIQFQVAATQPLTLSPGAAVVTGTLAVSGLISRAGSTVWDAANDGSGSGMDADLLDGQHASAFALLTDATRAGSNAYGNWEKRPNGVIEQWGTVNANYSEGQIAITFPIAFTDPNSIVVTPVAVNAVASDKFDISIQRVSTSVNGCVVFAQYSAAASSVNQINGIDWRAVGR